jgi:hypothetical protein
MAAIVSLLVLTLLFFLALAAAAVFTRLAYALTERVAAAPALDFFISLFTWIPWAAGGWLRGWPGVLAAVVAQLLFLHAFCLVHRALRGKKGRTITNANGRLLGPIRNQLALFVQTPAFAAFVLVRAAQLLLYPVIAALGRLPTYRQSEWVNLSRHKYDGLAGYDLFWCWYCDWMTGLWALGSEMLRNIESFWCPIQFADPEKNHNAEIDFPDVKQWAPPDGAIEDAVRLIEDHYTGRKVHSWWGHPDRKRPDSPAA